MLWRLTFAVALVCVGSMCRCVNADTAGRLMVPRDYGVKLCGREFIRAVIFTCGGSRWKRSVDMDLDPFQISYSDITEGDNQLTWQDGLELATDKRSPPQISSFSSSSSSYSLADLLALFGALRVPEQSADRQDPLGEFEQSAVAGQQKRNPAVTWPRANRRKRNFSLGVAGMCCNQGCTKNDIGRLC